MGHSTARTGRALFAASVALAALAAAQAAQAQTGARAANTASASGAQVGEVVVTARKRTETLQQAPVAIDAFPAQEIKSAKIERLADLGKLTPGLVYTPLFGAQNQLPIIRGAAQTFGQLNVGVFLDGVYLSGKAGVDLELNDLERVEVVKGPQSALYGRNTFAGAINYITKRPSKTFGGYAEGTVGEHGLYKGIVSVEGPITDTLRFRVGAYDRHFDGWYKSAIDGGKVDFTEVRGGQLTLEWQPVGNVLATLRVSGSHEDSGQPPSNLIRTNAYPAVAPGSSVGPLFAGATRNILFVGEVPSIPKNGILVNTKRSGYELNKYGQQVDNLRTSLDLRWDLDAITIESISAYAHRTDVYQFDADNTVCDGLPPGGANAKPVPGNACPSFGYPFAPAIPNGASNFGLSSADESFLDMSQELRVSSNRSGPLQWLLGANYYYNRTNSLSLSFSAAYPYDGTKAAFYGFPRTITETKAFSQFGSLSYKLLDTLTITGELRHETERDTYTQAPNNPACASAANASQASCFVFNGDGSVATAGQTFNLPELNFDFWTPRLIVDYKPSRDHTLYASVARGEKSGGFNSATNITLAERTYMPEKSWNYELGSKNRFLDRSLLLNGDVYYTDWTDQQVACTEPGTASSTNRTYVCNTGQARIYGLELEAVWRLTPNFSISGNYAYTHARYKKFRDDLLQGYVALVGLPPINFDGKHIPYVPDHKFVITPRYTMSVGSGFELETRADVSYQSKSYVRADNMAYFGDKAVVDLRATLSNDRWRLQVFADNVFDDDTPVAAVRFYDAVNYYVPAPLVTGADRREVGVTLGYRF